MLTLLLACTYVVPPDPGAPDLLNVLHGTVVLDGLTEAVTTVVLVYHADDPPPPTGTGRPFTFATIPVSAFNEGAEGVFSAPWSVTGIADGEVLVGALADPDENFQPILIATAGSTCGDWLGMYYSDLDTKDFASIKLEGGELVEGVTVIVDRENLIQRPAWQFLEDDTHSTVLDTSAFGPKITLDAIGVNANLDDATYVLDGPYDGTADCQTSFWTYTPDADGDGVADPHPNENFSVLGFKEYWPRVYMRYLGETPEDEYYGTELVPENLFLGNYPELNTPTAENQLTYQYANKALHFYRDEAGVLQSELIEGEAVPRGDWLVTVVQYTGQTWTLPNELPDYTSGDPGFDPALQGHYVTLQ